MADTGPDRTQLEMREVESPCHRRRFRSRDDRKDPRQLDLVEKHLDRRGPLGGLYE
jgi:hypothetical protein